MAEEPDRPRRDDPLVRGGRNGSARLRDSRPMPGPPRHPSQAPRACPPRAHDGAEARVRIDAEVRFHVLTRKCPTIPTATGTSGTLTIAVGSCWSGFRLLEGKTPGSSPGGPYANLDALVEGFRPKTPDPRYSTIGVVIGEDVLTAGNAARYCRRRASRSSWARPRKRCAFLGSMDELEFDSDRSRVLLDCLDLDAAQRRIAPASGARGRQARGRSCSSAST